MSGMTLQERMTPSIADAEALQKPAARCCGGVSGILKGTAARASRAARQLERLEHLADGLCLLGPSRRRALIERLSGEQRVALERQLIRRKQEGPLQAPAAKALRGGRRCRSERRSSASLLSTSRAKRSEAARTAKRGPSAAAEKRGALRPCRRLDKDLQAAGGGRRPPGLGMKRSRGFVSYYAVVGCDSLVFRGRCLRNREEAMSQLQLLRRLKLSICQGDGSFEERVSAAVAGLDEKEKSPRDNSAEGLTVAVRSATQHWLGRDLHTPSRPLTEIQSVLEARQRLQAVRGPANHGGRGLLCQYSIQEAHDVWARLRSEYLEICASMPGCDVRRYAATVAARESKCAAQREREEALARRRALRRAEHQAQERERKQLKQQRLLLRAEKAEAAAERRELRLFVQLERLLRRWRPYPAKAVTWDCRQSQRQHSTEAA